MSANAFQYPDERWSRMLAIVERAGGPDARERLDAQRGAFEKRVAVWRRQIALFNGRNFGQDETELYRLVEGKARGLKDALTALNFPALFIGDDLVWKPLADTSENEERFARFLQAIEHVEAKASLMARPRRKQARLIRDRFFGDLGRFWRIQLGLRITASAKSLFVAFVEAASAGVYQFRKADTTRDEILNVVRGWPRRSVCNYGGENS